MEGVACVPGFKSAPEEVSPEIEKDVANRNALSVQSGFDEISARIPR
jgi:hypothetical protein